MNYGLSEQELTYIVQAIQKFPEIQKAMIFGSRSKGNYKPGSDVDIAVCGGEITFDTLSSMHAMLEDRTGNLVSKRCQAPNTTSMVKSLIFSRLD